MRKLILFIPVILFVNIVRSQNIAKDVCNPINIFPFYESFNDTVFPPTCWKNYENDGTATTNIWKRVTTGTNPTCNTYSGNGMLQFNSYTFTSGKKALLVSPELNFSSNAYEVDFWIYRDNTIYSGVCDSVNIYVSSDTTITGALSIGRIYRSVTYPPIESIANKWYHYTFTIPQGATNGVKRLIIEGVSRYGNNIYMDDIRVREALPCSIPISIYTISTSNNTATIGWNSDAGIDSWDIEYGQFGFTQGTGTTINATTNSATLNGLIENTKYSYYIKANCNGSLGSSYWSDTSSFMTKCTPIDVLPFHEGFDNLIFSPLCWANLQTSGVGTNLIWARSDLKVHSGSASTLFNSSVYAIGTKSILVTKEFALQPKNHQISFWMYRDDTNVSIVDSVNIYYNSSPNTLGATLLGTVFRSYAIRPIENIPNQWYQYSFKIPQNTSVNCKYFIFEAISRKGNNIFIDDIKIDTLSNCSQPTALNATNIADTGATLKWTSTTMPMSWNVEYGVGGFAQGTETTVVTNTNTLILTNLTPNTLYSYYVQANCGGADGASSWSGPYYFSTLCQSNLVFPYTESFDGATFPPPCWQNPTPFNNYRWVRATSGTNPSCVPHSGAGMAHYPYDPLYGVGVKLITPPLNLITDNYVVKFWMYRDGGFPLSNDKVRVYLNDEPQIDSTSLLLGTIFRNNTKSPAETIANQWYQYYFCLPPGSAGANQHIIFEAERYSGSGIYIDDFVVEEQPACHVPLNLSVTQISDTEATLSWIAQSGESSWNIEYGLAGFVKGTGNVLSSNSNPTTISGLNSSTRCSYYVQANCGGTDGASLWAGPYTFKTSCPAIETFPITESFDGTIFPPNCWDTVNVNNYKWSRLSSGTTNPAHSGTGLACYSNNFYSTISNSTLASPPFNLPSDSYEVGFWIYRTNINMDDSINVYLSNVPNNTGGTLLGSIHVNSSQSPMVPENNQWYYYSFNFPAGSAGSYKYVVFEGVGISQLPKIYIDDIKVFKSSTCAQPTNLHVSNITSNSADVGWTSTGTESAWNIQYGFSGFLLGTGTILPSTTNPKTITSLNRGTLYSFYVQSNCGGIDSTSNWVGPYFFSTSCDSITSFPFIESFSVNMPICWSATQGASSAVSWKTETSDALTGVSGPQSGTHFMALDVYWANQQNNPYILTTQKIKLDNTPKRITYYYFLGHNGYTSTPSPLKVQISSDNGYSWNDVYIHTNSNSYISSSNAISEWRKNAIYLGSFINQSILVRFSANSNTNSSGSGICNIGIDEFVIENAPDCQPPTTSIATNILDSTALLSWTDVQGESSWLLEYGVSGFISGSGTIITADTNSLLIHDLLPGIQYEYRLKSNCDLNLYSNWSDRFTFKTACPVVSNLSATNLTSSSAELNWDSNGSETSWIVEYGNTGFNSGTGTVLSVSSKPLIVNGLSANSSYSYYVKTQCSGTDTINLWAGPYTFYTTCNPITTFPIVESFDNTIFAPNCWKNLQASGTESSNIWTRVVSGSNPTCSTHSGLGMSSFNCYYYSPNTKAILATSPFIIDTSRYQVSLWMYRDNGYNTNKDSVNIYYNTSPSISNGILLGTINRANNYSPIEVVANQWYRYTFYLPEVPVDSYKYIVLEGVSLFGNNVYIDDLKIDKQPSCLSPANASVDNITNTSAQIKWQSSGSNFKIRYKDSDATNWINMSSSDTSIVISGLIPSTTYQAQIMSMCSVADSSEWSSALIFTTNCISVLNFPFVEDFEESLFAPACWTNIQTAGESSGSLWYGVNNGNNPTCTPYSGSKMACFNSKNYGAGTKAILATPLLNIPSIQSKLQFWMYRDNQNQYVADHINIYINNTPSTDSAKFVGTYHRSASLDPISYQPNTWSKCEMNLPDEFIGNKYLIFEGVSNNGGNIYIDDIEIIVPNCPAPRDISVSDITYSSATIRWHGTGSSYKINLLNNNIITSDTVLILTGLNVTTTYNIKIKEYCNATDSSAWSSTFSFTTTDCAPLNLPYFENFDNNVDAGLSIPACSGINNVNMDNYTWGIYPNYSYTQPNSLIISESNWSDDWFYTPLLNLELGKTYRMKLKYKYCNTQENFCGLDIVIGLFNDTATSPLIVFDSFINGTEFRQMENTFSVTSTGPQIVSIHYTSSDVTNNYGPIILSLDDLYICEENSSDCAQPTTLSSSVININSALLDWTKEGNETRWNLQYKKSTDTNYVDLYNINVKPYILNGLVQNVDYIWRIQSIGEHDFVSEWSDDYTFTTTVGIDNNYLNGLSVYYYNNQINVINNGNILVKAVVVYDMIGREVGSYAINSTDNILINSNFTIGNYVVKVITENKVGNYKLFIK
jgi:hypothetical protein